MFLSLLTLSGWEQYANPVELDLPEPQHLSAWRWNQNYAPSETASDPAKLTKVNLNCNSDRLWPTHPQQTAKDYVYAVTASYENRKYADANAIVMSDMFQDECGNKYKGYWIVSFLSDEETMHTLISKGRRIIRKAGGFPGEFTSGSTFAVKADEFLFLTDLPAEENWKVELSQERALQDGYQLEEQRWVRN